MVRSQRTLLEREPPALLQAAVLGLAVATAAAFAVWAIGGHEPAAGESVPPVASQPLFRVPQRPQVPAHPIDEMPSSAWLAAPEQGAKPIDEPPVADFQPLRAVDAIVGGKATPEETEAFRDWLVVAAQAAADAAKEGGFMGFGAVQISEGEHVMLDQLRGALGRD